MSLAGVFVNGFFKVMCFKRCTKRMFSSMSRASVSFSGATGRRKCWPEHLLSPGPVPIVLRRYVLEVGGSETGMCSQSVGGRRQGSQSLASPTRSLTSLLLRPSCVRGLETRARCVHGRVREARAEPVSPQGKDAGAWRSGGLGQK